MCDTPKEWFGTFLLLKVMNVVKSTPQLNQNFVKVLGMFFD